MGPVDMSWGPHTCESNSFAHLAISQPCESLEGIFKTVVLNVNIYLDKMQSPKQYNKEP